jgi:hypothetical protein
VPLRRLHGDLLPLLQRLGGGTQEVLAQSMAMVLNRLNRRHAKENQVEGALSSPDWSWMSVSTTRMEPGTPQVVTP